MRENFSPKFSKIFLSKSLFFFYFSSDESSRGLARRTHLRDTLCPFTDTLHNGSTRSRGTIVRSRSRAQHVPGYLARGYLARLAREIREEEDHSGKQLLADRSGTQTTAFMVPGINRSVPFR